MVINILRAASYAVNESGVMIFMNFIIAVIDYVRSMLRRSAPVQIMLDGHDDIHMFIIGLVWSIFIVADIPYLISMTIIITASRIILSS